MFKFMFMCLHQIMRKMNVRCAKIGLITVSPFANTRSKDGGLVSKLLIFMFDLYINQMLLHELYFFKEKANFVYLYKILIK